MAHMTRMTLWLDPKTFIPPLPVFRDLLELRLLYHLQLAKNVVSDSPGLVDFAIGLVNPVFNLPDGQLMFFE